MQTILVCFQDREWQFVGVKKATIHTFAKLYKETHYLFPFLQFYLQIFRILILD